MCVCVRGGGGLFCVRGGGGGGLASREKYRPTALLPNKTKETSHVNEKSNVLKWFRKPLEPPTPLTTTVTLCRTRNINNSNL